MTAHAAPDAADLLRGVPAFSGLAASVRAELAARCELRTFRAGAAVLPAGGGWAGVAVVLSGEARLVDERADPVEIDRVAAGAVFAAESLLSGAPYAYQAYATSNCTVLLLSKVAFDDWLSTRPALRKELRQAAATHDRRTFLEGSLLAHVLEVAAIDRPPARRATSRSNRASISSPKDSRRPASTSSAPDGCASPAAASSRASSSPAMSWKKPGSCQAWAARPASLPRPCAECTRLPRTSFEGSSHRSGPVRASMR